MLVAVTNNYSDDTEFTLDGNVYTFGNVINLEADQVAMLSAAMFVGETRQEKKFLIEYQTEKIIEQVSHREEYLSESQAAVVNIIAKEKQIYDAINSTSDSEDETLAIYKVVSERIARIKSDWSASV